MTKYYVIEWGTNTLEGKILTRNSKRFECYDAAKTFLAKRLLDWQLDFWIFDEPKEGEERDGWNEMIETHYYHFYECSGTDCVEIGLSEEELVRWRWTDYDTAGFKKHE